ncbi:hypothetical protein I5H01_gp055 [Mycobacterium phage MarkPhew]|uniref:Uncharacterized protein n=1 Tax=Mycobacterium phage MarkPhew TaxID=2725625 RepID=A0A6M3SZD0_9CAUD|nr:hypothetical protein I5H01_gp055 [Mycobacterium phage MarkPhew]QJD50352.1 hypothetical protein SEA_MARKPHEW_52 [Mycobacterium phage MarkPhew]
MSLVTLTRDELLAAATVLDANLAAGMTSVAAVAHAMRAVNVMRTPATAADCVDCQRPDATCPGHLPNRKAAK